MDKLLRVKPDRAEGERTITVFVSYSRSDIAFTEKLVAALEACGFECLLDKRNLPFGEKWKAELEGFIRKADTVVFVVSPRSATNSEWCQWELQQTAALSKRLIPVMIEAVPPAKLPPQIGEVQLLHFDQDDRFAANVETLAKVLRTNRQWILAHTRLGEQAHEWTVSGRRGDRLLRRSALRAAEEWQRNIPADAPEVSVAQRTFIATSRKSQRKRNVLLGALSVVLVALLGNALVGAYWAGSDPEWLEGLLARNRVAQATSGDAKRQAALQSLELQRKRLKRDPDDKAIRLDTIAALESYAEALQDNHARMEAYKEAGLMLRHLSDENLTDPALVERSILADLRTSQSLLFVARQDESAHLRKDAIARYEKFTRHANPSFVLEASIVESALFVASFHGRGMERPAENASYANRAKEVTARLRKLHPDNPWLKVYEAKGLAHDAFWLMRAGRIDEADALYANITRLVDESSAIEDPNANPSRELDKAWLRDTLTMRDALKQEVKRN